MDETNAVERLRASGRNGAALFAACAVERLRGLLEKVPSGAPPLVAGVALTELWRILEGLQRPDPRRLQELSKACWTLVEIEPVEGIRTEHLEALVAAAHDALETYLTGNADHAIAAATKIVSAGGADESTRQERDLGEIATGPVAAALATRMRKRSESEGAALARALASR